jgi:hypothetical protein
MKRFCLPLIAALLLSSCSSYEIRPGPPAAIPHESSPLRLKVGLFSPTSIFDDSEEGGSFDFGDNLVTMLRQANLFGNVQYPLPPSDSEALDNVDLQIDSKFIYKSTRDPHHGRKEAIVTALTCTVVGLLFHPLVNFSDSFSTVGQLVVKDRRGNILKQYDEQQVVFSSQTYLGEVYGWVAGRESSCKGVSAKLVEDLVKDRAFFKSLETAASPQREQAAAAQRRSLPQSEGDGSGQAQKGAQAISGIRSDVDEAGTRLSERPDDFAIVVGIEKYSNDLPDAEFAEHDARAVKNHLLALGYPERNIKLLTGQRATYTGMSSYIEDWLPRNVKADSRVFFYFSGHGAPDPDSGQAYLVPSDGNPNFLDKSAYPLKKLYGNLNALKAKQVIVALDSCFSGAGGRSVLAQGARPLVSKVDTAAPSGGKLTIFAAASANGITTTLEDQGHGIFTYYFLKGLGGEAKDDSGVISARGLYDYLKPKVQDAASRQNRDQTPVLEGAGQDSELVRFNQ